MGGLKHVDVSPGRADQICGEIRRLAPDELEKVLDFVYAVVAQRSPSVEELGLPERLLENQSRWSFNEGERTELLRKLRALRGGEGQ